MEFAEYYGEPFRHDLAAIMQALPPSHEDFVGKVIQPRMVSRENQLFMELPARQRAQFAVALYFTLLTDQVVERRFRGHHARFQELTRYPRFHGDCPGGCEYRPGAERILDAVDQPPGPRPERRFIRYLAELRSSLPVLEREIRDFCRDHMPEISADEFWAECLRSEPITHVANDLP
jgi:hypothetical protein